VEGRIGREDRREDWKSYLNYDTLQEMGRFTDRR